MPLQFLLLLKYFLLWKEKISFIEILPFAVCMRQEVRLQTRQILLPSMTETRVHFNGASLQVQGTFCYVNETKCFVFVDVFKCQLVDRSVVLSTSNKDPESQSPAF